ncbi:MAG: hypothetical protein ACK5LO_14835 [Leucobacter sp.]
MWIQSAVRVAVGVVTVAAIALPATGSFDLTAQAAYAASPSNATSATAGAAVQSKKEKLTAKQKKELRNSKRVVLEVARQQSNYSGYSSSSKSRVLTIYAVTQDSKALRDVIRKEKKRTGLVVEWIGNANFTRAELQAAKHIVLKDKRVRAGKVKIKPYPGELQVQFKSRYRNEVERLSSKPGLLEQELGVTVPVVRWLSKHDVIPTPAS